MKKLIFIGLILALLLPGFGSVAMAAEYRKGMVQFVDERGEPRTDLTYVKIWNAGSATAATLKADMAATTSMTNPMTPTSTATGLRPENGMCQFYIAKSTYDVEAMVGGTVVKFLNVKPSNTYFQVPYIARPGTSRPKGGFCTFGSNVTGCQSDGTAASGTNTEVNFMSCDGFNFEQIVIGTQTIILPVMGATGLDIAQDCDAADEGWEKTQGITAGSRAAFTVGTDGPFHFTVKITMADVDGTDDFAIGFRKAEAYQAAVDNYDEMAAFNINGAGTTSKLIQTETILNGASTVTTALTDTFADAGTHVLTVKVDRDGAVTYLVDGAPAGGAVAFSFDSGEVVVPFMYMIHDTGYANGTILHLWDCGLDD
jgi:hypothetical protein